MDNAGLRERVDALLARVDLTAIVGAAVPLSRRRNPRGKCPFHGSKSDSLAVYPESGRFRCWGCGAGGDAIKFVELHYGLTFIQALEQLESQHGVDGLAANPARRNKVVQRPREREPISSAEMGRILWDEAAFDALPLRTFLLARGVPEVMLASEFLSPLRFHPAAPISAWVEGGRDRVPTAPAMLARVRKVPGGDPQAVHATFMAPDLKGKMERRDGRGELLPARKFLGSVAGGGVVFSIHELGGIPTDAPIFVAEGIETLLSGMALLDVPATAVGFAVLSLDNLQGGWLGVGKRRALPLHDPQPDPARPPVCFAHAGQVTGLIDADMKPLQRQRVVDRAGHRPIERDLTSAERSQLCAALFTRAWRNAGCRNVRAVRPPMGQDFNDLAAARTPPSFREALNG